MAIISNNTFDALNRYVSVRLQQGVPIVDADWNEREDIHRFEVRTFLKWFVGDGIPEGADAFRIAANGTADDFMIMAGGSGAGHDGLNAGRCLVNGLDVFITADLTFSAQPLHASHPDAAAQAQRAGNVAVIAVLSPTFTTFTIYLDVWERLVTVEEAPSLIHPGLGVESCVRLRREWAVRVRNGVGVPTAGSGDFASGHSYLALARVERPTAGAVITAAHITDLRRQGITVQPRAHFDKIARDSFGPSYALDGSAQPNLPFSLRAVINAMLIGGQPGVMGPLDEAVPDGPHTHPTSATDGNGDQWLFWIRPPGVGESNGQIRYRRQINRVWQSGSELLVTAAGSSLGVEAVRDAAGRIWVFWQEMRGAAFLSNIFARRFEGGAWSTELNVTENASSAVFIDELAVTIDQTDRIMVVWRQNNTELRSRIVRTNFTMLTIRTVPAQLRAAPAVITVNNEFVLFGLDVDTAAPPATPVPIRRTTSTGTNWSAATTVGQVNNSGPFELAAASDRFDGVWLFYSNGQPSITGLYLVPGSATTNERVLARTNGIPNTPGTMSDGQGNIHLYFRPGATNTLQQLLLIMQV